MPIAVGQPIYNTPEAYCANSDLLSCFYSLSLVSGNHFGMSLWLIIFIVLAAFGIIELDKSLTHRRGNLSLRFYAYFGVDAVIILIFALMQL